MNNADGSIYCTYSYDAWGNILSVKNANGVVITSAGDIANLQSLKYRGYVYDYETGLYYLQSRYYDPVTHRFINADGLVSTGTGILGYNMFAYCENNPVILIDYSGECILTALVVGAVAGAVIGALVSAGSQYIETGEIRWEIVLLDSAMGAVSGAFAATGLGLGVQIAVNAALGGASYVGNQIITGQEVEPVGFGLSVFAGGVAGCIGGPGADGSALISSWKSASKSTVRELGRQNAKYAAKRIAQYTVEKAEVKSALLIAFTRFVLGTSTGKYISNNSPSGLLQGSHFHMPNSTYLGLANKADYNSFKYTKRLCK